MKKFLTLLMCAALMLCLWSPAMAEEVNPGDTLTMNISITSASGSAANIRINTNGAPVTFVSASGAGSNNVTPPVSFSGQFVVVNLSGLATGSVGSVTFRVNSNAKAGTYTVSASAGLSDGSISVSGSRSFTVVIPPCAVHTWNSGTITTNATCTEAGAKQLTCTVCGEKTTETIPALGHTEAAAQETIKATCTTAGEKTIACATCGVTLRTESVAALGHKSDEGKETTAPTCTETGVKTYSCTVCGEELKTESVAALGHSMDKGTVSLEPTCTETGLRSYTCTVCHEEIENETIPANGHTNDAGTITTESTCTETGVKTFTCTVCGVETGTESVPANGHTDDAGEFVVEPTCTEGGSKRFSCAVCGVETHVDEVAALGHDKGEWIVIRPATDTEDGEKELHCTRCDALLDTAVIPYAVYYHMTVCTEGIRFRDISDITDRWDMFTPIDLSVDGVQTFDLIAGNLHRIGTVSVTVSGDSVTVTYELVNRNIAVDEEFLTFLPSLSEVATLEQDALTSYAFGKPISIQEDLGGDTRVLLYMCNAMRYDGEGRGIQHFRGTSADYAALVEELKALMD